MMYVPEGEDQRLAYVSHFKTSKYQHAQHQTPWYETRLHSHRGCIALLEVHLTIAKSWDARKVAEVFWHEHGRLKRLRRHASSLELLIRVWKVILVQGHLLGSEQLAHVVVCDVHGVIKRKLPSFCVRKAECTSEKRKSV